jgi:hypothetical protein
MPGEHDESEAGVDVDALLHTPGDPEYRVDGVLAEGKIGVKGGKFCVLIVVVRRLASSFGPVCVCCSADKLVGLSEETIGDGVFLANSV